ncbi:beta-L-arabinofuranosidase domain-containing protein [uncultured Algibacter sp.]|uniref:beta-L-arabinofuranosidase domain-containing protein n=1 Tax=uncultured Algibacter sp. TaxID=298659 RepID=UPI00261AB3EE|nr:beta-L-arabinofuranosidase domain-containing protein [uncultured Algibacter sp.]
MIKKSALIYLLLLYTNIYSQQIGLNDLPSKHIEPDGWVKDFLIRQENGLTGHPEESGFPFNTGMWTEDMDFKNREFDGGSPWWPFEQTAYYLDGALRCGYMNKSKNLKQRVLNNINYVLSHADSEGILHAGHIDDDWWPLVVFIRMLVEEYKNTNDDVLLQALENHYQSTYKKEESYKVPKNGGFKVRSVLHIEHLTSLYGITGNTWYLEVAEKLYNIFENNQFENPNGATMLTASGMEQGLKPSGHAVTYHEFLKIPSILYYHTGKEKYKKAIYTAYNQLEKHHLLADGLSSGVEELHGNNTDMAHEVCNIPDFNWTTGWALLATGDASFADKMEKVLYNAGFCSITSNFKAHQYYSAPNMPISSDMSSFYNDKTNWGFNGKGRLCYKPGHDTECCTGNIHRMFPTFLNRSCLSNEHEAKIVFYIPGTFSIPIGKDILKIKQVTNYPFEHFISLDVKSAPNKKIPLSLRIPSWVDSYSITLNGKIFKQGNKNNFFEIITRKFKQGDKIKIKFNTTPKIDKRKGIAINYGPLVFSYPIEARKSTTTSDTGRKSSNEFPAYQLFPKKHLNWAFALPESISENEIQVVKEKTEGYPWDYGNSPIKLKVNARSISNWKLKNNVSLSKIPENVELKDEPNQMLILEPMGATYLRITEFPVFKN